MNCKLIALDLDGTLNNDQKQITDRTYAALMDAQKRGIRLALASARPSPGLYRERDALRLQEYRGVLMSYNGGRPRDENQQRRRHRVRAGAMDSPAGEDLTVAKPARLVYNKHKSLKCILNEEKDSKEEPRNVQRKRVL